MVRKKGNVQQVIRQNQFLADNRMYMTTVMQVLEFFTGRKVSFEVASTGAALHLGV